VCVCVYTCIHGYIHTHAHANYYYKHYSCHEPRGSGTTLSLNVEKNEKYRCSRQDVPTNISATGTREVLGGF